MQSKIHIMINQPWGQEMPAWSQALKSGDCISVSVGPGPAQRAIVRAVRDDGILIARKARPTSGDLMHVPRMLIEKLEGDHLTLVDAQPIVRATYLKTSMGYEPRFECPFGCQSSQRSNGIRDTHTHGLVPTPHPASRTSHCSCWGSSFYGSYTLIPDQIVEAE